MGLEYYIKEKLDSWLSFKINKELIKLDSISKCIEHLWLQKNNYQWNGLNL